jgi:hypothetical protein
LASRTTQRSAALRLLDSFLYEEHPAHPAVVEKLNAYTTGCAVAEQRL